MIRVEDRIARDRVDWIGLHQLARCDGMTGREFILCCITQMFLDLSSPQLSLELISVNCILCFIL